MSISDALHQSVQLFLSVSEGSFQCCKLEILFERNHVFKKIKTTPKSGPDLRLFFPFFAFHPCHYSSLHLGTVLQIFELGVFHLLIQMMYGLYSAFALSHACCTLTFTLKPEINSSSTVIVAFKGTMHLDGTL